MAYYAASILPLEAAYYTMVNADIYGGIMNLYSGSHVTFNASLSDLPSLTNTMRLSVMADKYTDGYSPKVYARVTARPIDGDYTCHLCAITLPPDGVYSTELKFTPGNYDSLTIEFFSSESVSLTLWELCPEASEDVTVIIQGVEQSLPKLLHDYNTWPLSVGKIQRTIGLITCRLLKPTDLQGHLLISYTATSDCTLTIHFRDNDATELFAPLTYDIKAGRGSVGVPHAYLNRVAGYHNFVVAARVDAGELIIGTRGLLFTIDGGYLAERVIDIGAKISDLAVEQKSTDMTPSYIWVISVEAGEALVRRRKYSLDISGVQFEPMYSLGHAKEAAIEFDGDWYLNEEEAHLIYTLHTYAEPMCFFTDEDDNLYVQTGGNEDTRILLDSGVGRISVCRGFKSALDVNQDQGVICLYIKNFAAYYMHYVYNETAGVYRWEGPYLVEGINGVVECVHVQRLNDYRVGFSITTDSENYWLISGRTYVGMSTKPETVDVFADAMYPTVYLGPDYEALSLVSSVLTDDRLQVIATFSHPIRCLADEDLKPYLFSLSEGFMIDDNEITSVVINDNVLTITVKEKMYSPYIFGMLNIYYWQYLVNDQWVTFNQLYNLDYDPYAKIYNGLDERVSVNVHSVGHSIVQSDLVYRPCSYTETVEVKPSTTGSIVQHDLRYPDASSSVTVEVHTSATGTVEQIQTGESPI